MATEQDGLQFNYKPPRKGSKGVLSATLAGQALHTVKLDLANPDERAKALKSVCKGRPGIDRKDAAQKLEELAGGCVDEGSGEGERRSQADVLVELAAEAELFHDGERAFASVIVPAPGAEGGTAGVSHRENHPINGKGFREWLARRFWNERQKAPGMQAVQDALNVLSAKARFEGCQYPVAVRRAGHEGAIYLDLCDDAWRAVRVTPTGWEVVTDPPVRFVRRRGMQGLPEPRRGGHLSDLRPLINAGIEANWQLMVAWLLGALRPTGPYPILAANGEQGSGKTTTSRMLRRLIDPNEADLRAAPREERDLMIAATNSAVVAFDNLSTIPPELSDALCRLSTGGGFATRELYTDGEEKLFNATRPILFNGIEELATRPDLLERSLVLNLPNIAAGGRRSERDLWDLYEQVRPGVLGALLDVVVTALARLPDVRLADRPRMADFGEWVVAAEPALPWPDGGFLAAYRGNIESANELALEASAVGESVMGLMSVLDRWEGTAKELQAELESDRHSDLRTRQRRDWPRTPKGFSNALRRLAPTLRRLGVECTFGDREPSRERRRLIRLEQLGERPSEASEPSAGADSDVAAAFASDGGGRSADGAALTYRPAQNDPGEAAPGFADDTDGSDGHYPARSYTASTNGDGRDRGTL